MANAHARQLRKQLTPQDVKLWVHLRRFKKLGFHFRRQSPIGPYIVDFVCFSKRIVVEADGGQHGEPDGLSRDRVRDAFLESQGFEIVRYWNSEIDQNLSGVVESILGRLKAPTPPG